MAEDDAKPTYSNVFKVEIDGIDISTLKQVAPLVHGCWVECSMNLPTAFHVTFDDNYQQLLASDELLLRPGTSKVKIYGVANGQGKEIPMVTGLLTGIETDLDGHTTTTVIRGLDYAFKMMRKRRTKGYMEMTATEIVRFLATEDGVMVDPELEMSNVRYKMITQPNISDWQFVNELAARNGMYADFDNEGLLRFRKLPMAMLPMNIKFPEMPLVLEVGGNAVNCRSGITAADQVDSVTVRGWDTDTNMQLKAESSILNTYRGRKITASPLDVTPGVVTYVETSTPYGSSAEVEEAADALYEEIGSVFAELEVLAYGNPALMPGETVELKKAGKPFDGMYTVTAARHDFLADGTYMTLVTVTGRQVRNIYGLAAGAGGPSTRIPGVVNAIVDDINDSTNQGRVKVTFPWLDDTYKTRWARSLQFGGHGGGVISPAVGDEVLVAFDRGDINYPYVLGGLYGHELNKPSEHDTDLVTEGHLNRQSLVSRAGHRLELLDADIGVPMHGVRLQTGDRELTVFLDEAETEILINSDGRITVTGKEEVSISSTGPVSVTSDDSISIKAPRITLEGGVTIRGALTQELGTASFDGAAFSVEAVAVNLNAVGELSLTSEALAVVAAQGPLQLKGSPAVAVAPYPPIAG